MTILELYQKGAARLHEAGIPDASLEAELLLGHLLEISRAHIFLHGNQPISADSEISFNQMLLQRLTRMPLAYIIGQQEFWSLPFFVAPQVLIPRPETEELLEIILRQISQQPSFKGKILDLGTGSGVIAIVLARELSSSNVLAVDRSLDALLIARRNAERHLEDGGHRLELLCSSWAGALKADNSWDLIVSNPPYVAYEALNGLEPEVLNEPIQALDGGEKGMEAIRKIAVSLPGLLKEGGWFFMEIGYDQKEYVLDLFNGMAEFDQVMVHNDYGGQPRILQARRECITSI